MSLLLMGDIFLVTPAGLKKRAWKGQLLGDHENFYQIVAYLAKKGLIKYVNKDNERFIKITSQGELEALLAKAQLPEKPQKWDGKWRVIMFDIPEESESKRNFFRSLLKKNNYIKLQHSVYVSPYSLNREAVIYLNKTGLNKFIKILKVEEMDSDKDLRKKFNLKK